MATIFSQKAVINYHMVLPEWFALIHEFSGEEDNASANGDSPSKWLSGVRKATEEKLRAVTSATIGIEHRMATVLNPRLKHLPIICTDLQSHLCVTTDLSCRPRKPKHAKNRQILERRADMGIFHWHEMLY
uniref:40S ribosomal protein S7 n=1 Tax=Ascaris lumbricoides TaxID=6252 RepID=A0A0M3HFU4_ASCLU